MWYEKELKVIFFLFIWLLLLIFVNTLILIIIIDTLLNIVMLLSLFTFYISEFL